MSTPNTKQADPDRDWGQARAEAKRNLERIEKLIAPYADTRRIRVASRQWVWHDGLLDLTDVEDATRAAIREPAKEESAVD
ncbi:MAG: hypothetical protein V1772_09205 [Chloroflexota bacterium]